MEHAQETQEAQEAFSKAIVQGRLSRWPNASNFAGRYMYMGKTPDGTYDTFKNINTREYDV